MTPMSFLPKAQSECTFVGTYFVLAVFFFLKGFFHRDFHGGILEAGIFFLQGYFHRTFVSVCQSKIVRHFTNTSIDAL